MLYSSSAAAVAKRPCNNPHNRWRFYLWRTDLCFLQGKFVNGQLLGGCAFGPAAAGLSVTYHMSV